MRGLPLLNRHFDEGSPHDLQAVTSAAHRHLDQEHPHDLQAVTSAAHRPFEEESLLMTFKP